MLPATTGSGDAVFVTVISANAVLPTTTDALAVLFEELGSFAEELTEAVSVITVPFAVPLLTLTTSVNVAAVEPGIFELLQTKLPFPTGLKHVHPAGDAIETKVVFAGMVPTSVALSAALGPLLVTVCVYVMLLPAATGLGAPTLVTLRSALDTTVATSVAVSFDRLISPPPLTIAVLATVDGAVWATLALIVIDG